MSNYLVRTTQPTGNLPEYSSINGAVSPAWNSCILGNYQGTWNQGQPGANVLHNCTGFAQGRMIECYNEINGNPITSAGSNIFSVFNADAQKWYRIAQNNGFSVGSSPAAGCVGVWANGGIDDPNTIGHVAFFERYANGRWEISEGHAYYDGGTHGNTWGSWDYSYIQSNGLPAFIESDPSWYTIGYIYLPGITPDPGGDQPPGPTPGQRRKMPIWMYLKRLPF